MKDRAVAAGDCAHRPSDRFLGLSKGDQARLIKGFDFKWFDFSSSLPGQAFDAGPRHTAVDRNNGNGGSSAAEAADSDDELTAAGDAFEDNFASDAGSRGPAAPPAEPEAALQARQAPAAHAPAQLRPAAPLPRAEDATLLKHFSTESCLLIAAYTDSRKLIENFTRVSSQLGLTPIQWTFSEGFKEVDDKYAGRYTFSDKYFMQARLSPLESLGCIRSDCQANTLYLLEDFHYYLKRENLSAQDFVELISIIKSMPEVLKRLNSFVVILAPTLDLPPEIAPIFGIIRDEAAGRRLHMLERYGRDLTQLVAEGRIKPIIGRDREIFACLKVLSQMESNNPILVGKAGVGKTAVVEGLAGVIMKKEVPPMFKEKRIIALNLNAIVSGTKYRGEFENRIEGIVEEVRSNVGRIIVFIDEIHTLLGMGSTEGSTGAENILKPCLARGEFPCIGATTSEEYRKYIEPDRALARRFQTVVVPEPDGKQSLDILKGIKSIYENHYGLKISDKALGTCVEMASRYLHDQCFPGKAIRMLDSVCASASLAGRDAVTPQCVAEEFNRL